MNRKKNNGPKNRLEDFLDGNDPVDDFEKEALEGFSSFERKEMIDGQAELDARFSRTVLASEKKESARSYWVAAAALLIVSSLTGYFLLQNAKPQKDLALQQETKKVAPQTLEEKKSAPEEQPQERSNSVKEKNANPLPSRVATKPEADVEKTAFADEPVKDDLSNVAREEQTAPQTAIAEPAPAPADKTFAGSGTLAMQSREEPQESIPAAPAEADQRRADGKSAKKTNVVVTEAMPSSSTLDMAELPNSCYYEKGRKQLHKDLVSLLQSKDLVKRFDARLFINQRGRIDSLDFMNTYKLTQEEQQRIKTELSGFGGFIFIDSAGQDIPAEYVLSFKP